MNPPQGCFTVEELQGFVENPDSDRLRGARVRVHAAECARCRIVLAAGGLEPTSLEPFGDAPKKTRTKVAVAVAVMSLIAILVPLAIWNLGGGPGVTSSRRSGVVSREERTATHRSADDPKLIEAAAAWLREELGDRGRSFRWSSRAAMGAEIRRLSAVRGQLHVSLGRRPDDERRLALLAEVDLTLAALDESSGTFLGEALALCVPRDGAAARLLDFDFNLALAAAGLGFERASEEARARFARARPDEAAELDDVLAQWRKPSLEDVLGPGDGPARERFEALMSEGRDETLFAEACRRFPAFTWRRIEAWYGQLGELKPGGASRLQRAMELWEQATGAGDAWSGYPKPFELDAAATGDLMRALKVANQALEEDEPSGVSYVEQALRLFDAGWSMPAGLTALAALDTPRQKRDPVGYERRRRLLAPVWADADPLVRAGLALADGRMAARTGRTAAAVPHFADAATRYQALGRSDLAAYAWSQAAKEERGAGAQRAAIDKIFRAYRLIDREASPFVFRALEDSLEQCLPRDELGRRLSAFLAGTEGLDIGPISESEGDLAASVSRADRHSNPARELNLLAAALGKAARAGDAAAAEQLFTEVVEARKHISGTFAEALFALARARIAMVRSLRPTGVLGLLRRLDDAVALLPHGPRRDRAEAVARHELTSYLVELVRHGGESGRAVVEQVVSRRLWEEGGSVATEAAEGSEIHVAVGHSGDLLVVWRSAGWRLSGRRDPAARAACRDLVTFGGPEDEGVADRWDELVERAGGALLPPRAVIASAGPGPPPILTFRVDPELFGVPFGALHVPGTGGVRLCEVFRVRVALRRRPKERPSPPETAGTPGRVNLIVGDPVLAPQPVGLRLRHSGAECRAVEAGLPGRSELALRAAATFSRLAELAPSATHIHIAAHGRTSFDPMREGELLLAPEEARPDGVWSAADVRGLRLPRCDWVVLSCCSSAAASPHRLDSVLGAFLDAGARFALGTLWPVRDEHARDFMTEVYGLIAGGTDDFETAVNRVQSRRARGGDDPRAWAVFQVFAR